MDPRPTAKRPRKDAGSTTSGEQRQNGETHDVSEHCSPLPATSWGLALQYLQQGSLNHGDNKDVSAALLTCREVRFEATKFVLKLHVNSSSELDVPFARQFPQVKEVSINFTKIGAQQEKNPDGVPKRSLVHATASKIIPFLGAFPRLKSVRFDGSARYFGNRSILLCNLMRAFCGAFLSRSLPPDLDLHCSVYQGYYCHDVRCILCAEMFKVFPIRTVADWAWVGSTNTRVCVGDARRFEIIAERPRGLEYLRSKEHLRFQVSQGLLHRDVFPSFPELTSQLTTKGAIINNSLFRLSSDRMESIEILVTNHGLDPSIMRKEEFLGIVFGHLYPEDERDSDDNNDEIELQPAYSESDARPIVKVGVYRSAIQRLITLGFNVTFDDFLVSITDGNSRDELDL